MPRFDGSGPMGYGPMTGRGFGYCYDSRPLMRMRRAPRFGRGPGFGYGRGFGYGPGYAPGYGRGYGYAPDAYAQAPVSAKDQKQWLAEQKEMLQQELDYVSGELEKLDKE